MKKIVLGVFVLIAMQIVLINCQINLRVISSCAGKLTRITCGVGETVSVYETIYGIRNPSINECQYTQGDCFEETQSANCLPSLNSCLVTSSLNKILGKCSDKKADYIQIKYFCVPTTESSTVKTVSLCSDQTAITSEKGFITSLGYPTYKTQNQTCVSKITVPAGKSINVWVIDLVLRARDSSENCVTDYLKITDNTGTYDACGTEKPSYFGQLCSNQLFVSFLAQTQPTLFSGYRGFKLYYETYDTSSSGGCTTETPINPLTTTTLAPTTSGKLTNFEASPVYQFQVCRDFSPKYVIAAYLYTIYIEKFVLGVTNSPKCEDYDPQKHCTVPNPYTCNLKTYCIFRLPILNLTSCSNTPAQYLYAEYRLIPTSSNNTKTIGKDINADESRYGIIQTDKYPNWIPYQDNYTQLVSSNPKKAFKIYVTDFNLDTSTADDDEPFNTNYVLISDDFNQKQFKHVIDWKQDNIFVSCSNNVTIRYVTIGDKSFDYRGLRAYYELIDRPANCPSKTTPRPTTTQKPATTDIVNNVMAIDQHGVEKPCVFPFSYKGVSYTQCTNQDQSQFWCSLTANYDTDQKKGNCKLGSTGNVGFEICKGSSRKFSCPSGYVINIVSAEFATTTDGSCDINKKKCSENAISRLITCIGINSCVYRPLGTACGKPVDFIRLDYTCIPDKVDMVKTSQLCQITDIVAMQGIIQSPNYPKFTENLNCKISFKTQDIKLISIYAIDINLEYSFLTGGCKSSININGQGEICGTKRVSLISQQCSNSFDINLLTGAKNNFLTYRGVRLFYEVTEIPDGFVCPATTQIPVSTTPSSIVTTPPEYVVNGLTSKMEKVTLCSYGTVKVISCPAKYTILIRDTFFGYSQKNNCFHSKDDCVLYSRDEFRDLCSGKQSCVLPNKVVRLPECNLTRSNYMRFDYECVPSQVYTPVPMCGQTLSSSKSGIIGGPVDAKFANCQSKIQVSKDKIMKVYVLNLDLDANSTVENLKFSEDGLAPYEPYFGQDSNRFAFQTCTNVLNVNLQTHQDNGNRLAAAIYYEEIDIQADTVCGQVTAGPSTQKPLYTTTTTPPYRPPYFGRASDLITLISCGAQTFSCPSDYVIMIEETKLGVKNSSDANSACTFNSLDCFSQQSLSCSGDSDCSVSLSKETIKECANKKPDYFYINYRCVPQSPVKNMNIYTCDQRETTVFKEPNGILQSFNYPNYPYGKDDCKFTLTPPEGYGIKFYLLDLSISNMENVAGDYCVTDHITFNGMLTCKSTQPKLAFTTEDSSSAYVEFRSLAKQGIEQNLRGFRMYFEIYSLSTLTSQSVTRTKPPRRTTPNFLTPITAVLNERESDRFFISMLSAGVPIAIVLIICIVILFRMNLNMDAQAKIVRFSNQGDEGKINEDIRSFSNPSAMDSSSNALYDNTDLSRDQFA